MERINLSSIKKESVRAIFNAITGKDQISRAEIAEITGLSLMTVGKVVDALLERHVIIQSKEIKNMAGRRAGLVSLNTDKFFMIIDLTSRNMSMTVMDIALNIVDKITYEYNGDFYYEENLYIFMKNVKIYILRKLDMAEAAGIGVVLPGTYVPESDTVVSSRVPELAQTHVRAIIEDVLRCPVDALEKDVLTAAASNLADLEKESINSVAYVCIGETISGALISGGEILHGRQAYAGDIGRVLTEANGTLQALFEQRGLRDETVAELARALAYEIALFDPDIVLIENCTGGKMEQYRAPLVSRICRVAGFAEEELPQIRILETGVRHAYRGLAIRMRSAWIQKEVN
ncbi:MAG: ROK family transcriptional regulator [Clostridia bacterium]|nr:ROK family transcriptional regulator [Clostridia bacterium]